MKSRRAFSFALFLALPWAIILLVPELRLAARLEMASSEYIGLNSYRLSPEGLEPWTANQSLPLPPSQRELWRNAGNDKQLQVAALLKAPALPEFPVRNLHQMRQIYFGAVQLTPDDPALLAAALTLVENVSVIPPLGGQSAELYDEFIGASDSPAIGTQGYGELVFPLAAVVEIPEYDISDSSSIAYSLSMFIKFFYDIYPNPAPLPPSLLNLSPLSLPMPPPPLEDISVRKAPSVPPLPSFPTSEPPGGKYLTRSEVRRLHEGPSEMRSDIKRHVQAALRWARHGSVLEPQNAWWDWMMISYYYSIHREEEMLQALHRASIKPHFNAHLDFDGRMALRAAELHRPLLAEEKISIWERQSPVDVLSGPQASLLYSLIVDARRQGRNEKALSIAGDTARLAACMQREASSRSQLRFALALQGAAWVAIGGPVKRKFAPLGKSNEFYTIPFEIQPGNKILATPVDFARQFASFSRRARRPDLAREALRLSKEANRQQKLIIQSNVWDSPVTPGVLIPLESMKKVAFSELVKGNVALLIWLGMSLLLWKPLYKPVRWLARIGHRFTSSSLGQSQALPVPPDSPQVLTRTVRVALWLGAFLTAIGSVSGLLILPSDRGLTSGSWPLADVPYPLLLSVEGLWLLGPFSAALLCTAIAPLRHLLRQHRAYKCRVVDTPGFWPILWLFAAWSLTFYAVCSWILSLLNLTQCFLMSNFLENHPPASWVLVGALIEWLPIESYVRNIALWISDYSFGPLYLTLASLGLWLVKWHRELPPSWRWSAIYDGVLCLRRVMGAWVMMTGWLFLIFLTIAWPYRQAADTEFTQMLAQKHPPIESGLHIGGE